MTGPREHVIPELADYVLGALDAPDRSRVNAHLAACATCAERLTEYEAVIGSLAFALPAVPPPAEAWPTIREASRRRRSRTRSGAALDRRWLRAARWSAVAAVVAGLVVWNVGLQHQVARDAEGPQIEKLARRPGRLVILAGTAEPQASARLFAAVDGRGGHMAVAGLKRLPAGRVYQLWFLRSTAPAASAATFPVDEDGRAWVVVKIPRALDDTDAIVVTVEPAPGSTTPTGPPLLEATHWR